MTEMLMIISMTLGGLLFSLGGLKYKWLRRFLLPVCLGIIAVISWHAWYYAGAMTLCLMLSLSLPYGERTPTWGKALTFIAIFGSTAWLGFSWWQIIGAVLAIGLFKLSNMKWTQNIIAWKIWEFITGSLLGITVASLIGR